MFIGEYKYNIDEKGRLIIPPNFRENLKEGAVITRGLDSSLFLYSMTQWKQMAEKLSQLPISQKDTRAFARLMLAGAMEVSLDKQGRIVLPNYLSEYAGLKKKVVVAGLFDRVEIWDESKWNTYKTQTEKNSEKIAERLGDLGV